MYKKEKESLIDALAHCSLRDIPAADDGSGYWLEALARVAKRDGTKAYVYAVRNIDTLDIEIKIDFGTISGIAFVEEYYPFEFLRDEFMPKLSNKDERVKHLANGDEEVSKQYSKMSVKALDELIIKNAIKTQKAFDSKKVFYG